MARAQLDTLDGLEVARAQLDALDGFEVARAQLDAPVAGSLARGPRQRQTRVDQGERAQNVGAHRRRALVAVVAPELERSIEDAGECDGDLRRDGSDARRRKLSHLLHELDRRRAFVDPPPRDETKSGRGEREQIGAPVDLVVAPRGLLRRHERRRAERDAVHGHRAPLEQPRKAEIEHLDAVSAHAGTRDEDVVRLDVAVHDPAVVRNLEHLEDHVGDHEKVTLGDRQPTMGPPLERLTHEQLHDQVRRAVVGAARDDVVVEHLDDARVFDAIGGVTLAEEPTAHILVLCVAVVEHLHGGARPVAMQPGVHCTHPADAEQALELPLVVENLADTSVRPAARVVARRAGACARTHPFVRAVERLSVTWHHTVGYYVGRGGPSRPNG